MQNPFIKNTVSAQIFDLLQNGAKRGHTLKSRTGASSDQVRHALKRDTKWLYHTNAKRGGAELHHTFRLREQGGIDKQRLQKQIENTDRYRFMRKEA